jgi:hypothetical protein
MRQSVATALPTAGAEKRCPSSCPDAQTCTKSGPIRNNNEKQSANMSAPATGTFFQGMKRSFADVPTSPGIAVEPFCEAVESLVKLFGAPCFFEAEVLFASSLLE